MYNGIGLQTARGSGTSGYVQKNLSYNVKKLPNRQQFLKELEQKRKQDSKPNRKANPQIVQHQRKRQILLATMKLKKQLTSSGKSEQQINESIKKLQKKMKEKFEKGEVQGKNRDSHIMTQAKQKQFNKIQRAFGVNTHDKGSAFNFQEQRELRLKKMQERRKRKQVKCPFSHCQKVYESKQRLDRHLKYKHTQEQKKQILKKQQQEYDD